MHIETYDYITGTSLGPTSLSGLEFGDIIQNQHCSKPLVLRAVADPSDSTPITGVRLFLENKGPWKGSEYGYKTDSSFIPSVESGSFPNHFTEALDASSSSTIPPGVALGWHGAVSDYVWLDAQIFDSTGLAQANFRIFYDF